MNKIVTYDLCNGKKNSNSYYNDIENFSKAVLEKAEQNFSSIFNAYEKFIVNQNVEIIRSREEYIFEFLLIGIFWNRYSGASLRVKKYQKNILKKLYHVRQQKSSIKKFIDPIRGILSTIFLFKTLSYQHTISNPSLFNFILLIDWLEASGEFKQEVKRLKIWENFYSSLYTIQVNNTLTEAIKFANWFEAKAEIEIGIYTPKVEEYLHKKIEKHLFKEDIIFCARGRNEYHANMFGAAIMNKAFKNDFNSSKKKAVLVPSCIRIKNDNKCKAKREGLDYICDDCTPGCRVHQLKQMGKNYNFDVYIIPHSSDFSKWLKEKGVNSNIGTIGIACINNLIAGGLELKELDIPAQCVLLDYCGCKNHWDEKGFATDVNVKILKQFLDKEEIKNPDDKFEKENIAV